MASLNTLRTKGGLIISIVIGLALLAFLLGDLTSSQSILRARKMQVGEINGERVGYEEYHNQQEQLKLIFQMMYGRDALSGEEQDMVSNMAWEMLVVNYSFKPGFEQLGVFPGGDEQVDMAGGAYTSPVLSSIFADPKTGMFDKTQLQGFVSTIGADKSGRTRMLWNYFEDQMNVERSSAKFSALMGAGMFANDLDIAEGVKAANTVHSADVVARNYYTVPDSLVKVSATDLKAYYEAHKKSFKRTAVRDIEYAVFRTVPSEEDYETAKKYVDELAVEFSASDAPMQYASLNSQVAPDARYLGVSELDPAIAEVVFGNPGTMYGPVLNNNTYTIARQADMRMMPDTIGARSILLAAADEVLADSLAGVLRKGGDFAQLAAQYSLDQQSPGGDMGRFAPSQYASLPKFMDAMLEAPIGKVFAVRSQAGWHVAEVTYKSPLVRKAQVAVVKYNVLPSSQTDQKLYAQVSDFYSKAAGSYDNFVKAAAETGVSKRAARISPNDRNVSGIGESRTLVHWAFNNNKGQVSDIMQMGGDYVVAAVTGVQEEGVQPYEKVKQDIMPKVYDMKKADYLLASLKPTSLQEAAAGIGGEIVPVEDISFESGAYISGIGVDGRLAGALTADIPVGQLSKPVRGVNGVYFFQLTAKNPEGQATPDSERVRQEAVAGAYMLQKANQAMTEQSNVKDWRYRFY